MAKADLSRAKFAPVYVERCRIRNFRGITKCDIEFEPDLTLLVGRNNAGKSRVLRALSVALGRPADRDDLTVGSQKKPTIDIIIAPNPNDNRNTSEEASDNFKESISQRLGLNNVQAILEEPRQERFSWRTTIRRSAEGFGVRSEAELLTFDPRRQEWVLSENAGHLTRNQRLLFAVELVNTRRDLSREFFERGSAIQKVLSDLEIDEKTQGEIEQRLSNLSKQIVSKSTTLRAVKKSLADLTNHAGTMGKPALNPLPPRLEELARSISIDLDTGSGDLPMRFHGAGVRSLASLQIQGVNYDRRLGRDGPNIIPHPLTLVEEPEAHLHPQAEFGLGTLLSQLPGQIVASTHTAHIVTTVDHQSIRLLRTQDGETTVVDLKPVSSDDLKPVSSDTEATPRVRRPSLHTEEMEKLKRQIERPFGELLFASAVIIGDGATERAFLPPVLAHVLGHKAHGVCTIDPESLGNPLANAAVKFAKLVGIPWLLFADSDKDGRTAATRLDNDLGEGDGSHIVWIESSQYGTTKSGIAFEEMMIDFDEALCEEACSIVRPKEPTSKQSTLDRLKKLKGSVGATLADQLIKDYPDYQEWPRSLQELILRFESQL